MNRSLLASVVIFGLVCSLAVPMAYGQAVFGNIIGTVTDPSGAAVANAKVTVTSKAKGTSFQTTTNASGNYTVTHLIPDVYAVSVESAGFKTLAFENINVSADADSRVDGQFQVGSTTEEVQVTAEAPQLKTDRADVSIEFNERYVADLPIMNRNFTSFELLSPGTQKLVGWSHAATENPQGSQQIFVNGQHFSGTAFELDGTDNQDPILGIIVVNPNLDAIQETKVDLQNYDAEFGKALGGVVTVQTKSGTNDFHGEGFWFRRTDAEAARDPFTQFAPNPITGRFIPPDKWQQFGGTFGGPIIKDKLFFFVDYQGTRESNGTTNVLTVPTATVETTCNPATSTGVCDLSQYLGVEQGGNTTLGIQGGQVFKPVAGDGGGNRTAYANNQIPIGDISTQAAAILALFPAPTNSQVFNNYIASGTGSYTQNSFDTRVDFTASPTVQVFGRFSFDHFHVAGAGSYGALEGVGFGPGGLSGSSITHNYSLASGVTKTFSLTLLGDFRFGYFKYNPRANKPDVGTTPMTNAGIPNANLTGSQALFTSGWGGFLLNQTPSTDSANSGNFGSPTVSWGDGLGVGRCNCPLLESEQQFQWVGNITKIHGNHQFKFGADFRYAMNLRVPSDAGRTGDYTFDYRTTSDAGNGGLDWATFLLGDVTQVSRYVSPTLNAAERQHRMFYYGQDTWRLTPKFTLNYGLRWEVYFPEYVNGKDNGGFANLVQGEDRVAGEGGIGLNGNIANAWDAFAPRFGIAYQVNPKTVVRMGYGRSFDMGVFGSNFGHTVTQTLPVLAAQLAQGPNQEIPAFTLAQGPPIFNFPSIPSNGLLPVSGPNCYQFADVVNGQNSQLCVQPHIRPTRQRLPTLDAWNATVQRQLTETMSVNIAYVGNKGTHVFAGDGPTYNVNNPSINHYCANAGCSVITPQPFRRPYFNAFTYTGYADPENTAAAFLAAFPGYTSPPPGQVQGVLQCCSTDQGNYLGNDASSKYNAFQVELEKRFSHGLQVLSHYTFAHAYKYDSSYYPDDPRIAYGPDDEVRNQVWVNNVVYQLPFGRGQTFAGNSGRAEDLVIGGWQITGTTTWGSGLPWTPSTNECGGEQDVGVCRPNKGTGSFPLGVGPLQFTSGGTPYRRYFTPLTSLGGPFTDAGNGNLGNVGVFSYRGPRVFFADASILKNFNVTERVKFQFRMDAFNVFNHPVLGFNNNQNGGTCIDCAGNGQITDIEHDASPGSATGMRQLEFALKLMF